jgi:hypothetical protein
MHLIEEILFDAFPNPDRVGCPEEATIMALAENKLLCDDPVCLHVVACSECFAEYYGCCLELENSAKASAIIKPRVTSWSGIATHLNELDDTVLTKAMKSLRERIASYHHKYSR